MPALPSNQNVSGQRQQQQDSQESQQETIGQYTLTAEIGRGSFAIVHSAFNSASPGTVVAVKAVQRKKLTAKLLDNLQGEISILRRIRHPNIVSLTDCIHTPDRILLVMDFCSGGDLSNYIKKRGNVPTLVPYVHPAEGGLAEPIVRSFLGQLANACLFLRQQNLIHRDIKPQNLLLHPASNSNIPLLKVADFGFARSLAIGNLAETLCGSPLYMAPEILRYEKYSANADLWSVGAVLYEMSCGRPPFRAQNHVELLKKIEKGEDRIKFPSAQYTSEDIKSLICSLLKRQPSERMSFDEFFANSVIAPWIINTNMANLAISVGSASNSSSRELHLSNAPAPIRAAPPVPAKVIGFESKYVVGGASSSKKSKAPSDSVNATIIAPQQSRARSASKSVNPQSHLSDQTDTRKPSHSDDQEYVVVEKTAVEINDLADDLADAMKNQQRIVKQRSRTHFGTSGPVARRQSFTGAMTGYSPPSPRARGAISSTTTPDMISPAAFGAYNPYQITRQTSRIDFPTLGTSPGNTPNTLQRAFSLGAKIFGTSPGTANGSFARVQGRRKTFIRIGETNAEEVDLFKTLDDLLAKSSAISEFADSRLMQSLSLWSSSLSIPPCFIPYFQEHYATMSPQITQRARTASGSLDVSPSVDLEQAQAYAIEALVLYIKGSTYLSRGVDAVRQHLADRATRTGFREASEHLTDFVQLLRMQFNESFDKAGFARSRCADGSELPSSAAFPTKIIFEQACELAASAAQDELTGDNPARDEQKYESALNLLKALLDDSSEDKTAQSENTAIFAKYALAVEGRLAALRSRIQAAS